MLKIYGATFQINHHMTKLTRTSSLLYFPKLKRINLNVNYQSSTPPVNTKITTPGSGIRRSAASCVTKRVKIETEAYQESFKITFKLTLV